MMQHGAAARLERNRFGDSGARHMAAAMQVNDALRVLE